MKKQKENVRSKRGITLIALVVTIVVLLILAGITISTLFGENGIINAARRAEEETARDENTTNEGLQNLEDKMHNQLGIDTSSLAKLISTNSFVTTEQGNQIVSDKTGKPMIVPVGFKIADDSATEIDKGVVIEDKEYNQYVWVPVSDSEFGDMFGSTISGSTTNYFGKLYDFTTNGKSITTVYREPDIVTQFDGSDATNNASTFKTTISETMTGSEFQTELQDKFNEMAQSVKEYKGFYIGRYEASFLDTANPKTVKGVMPSNSINWYNMYKNMQGVERYTNSDIQSDVKTNIIWGCQWDRTLDWIANTDTKIGYAGLKNSKTWGNYYTSETFTYRKTDNTEGTKTQNSRVIIPTGSTERNMVNNIYDLAGNLYEWTMQTDGSYSRMYCGGTCSNDYGSDGPVSSRGSNAPTNNSYSLASSRPTLYVIP